MTGTDRRLQAEWDILEGLAHLNTGRIDQLLAEDHVFRFALHKTSTSMADPPHVVIPSHSVRIVYPFYFPTAPLEVYVERAFLHPNVHPLTGFVCVWDHHRVYNTVEHALHKLVSMMSGRLYNLQVSHVMQPFATGLHVDHQIVPLLGISPDRCWEDFDILPVQKRRRRLS